MGRLGATAMNKTVLLPPREAARILGISYPTLKQWIYRGKIRTAKTPGGHHRVPESEIDRMLPKQLDRGEIETRRGGFRKISGRNQLLCDAAPAGRCFEHPCEMRVAAASDLGFIRPELARQFERQSVCALRVSY